MGPSIQGIMCRAKLGLRVYLTSKCRETDVAQSLQKARQKDSTILHTFGGSGRAKGWGLGFKGLRV